MALPDLTVALSTHLVADVAERRSAGESRVLSRRHAPVLRTAGIGCVVDRVAGDDQATTLFPTSDLIHTYHPPKPFNPSFVKHGLKLLEHVRADLDESADSWGLATTAREIRATVAAGNTALVLGLLGSTPLEDDPAILEIHHRLGVRVVALASEHANAATGTHLQNPTMGLSGLGRSLVETAQRMGMIVDATNLSKPAFWDLVDMVEGPLIVSAGNAWDACHHPANLTGDQLSVLADRESVVGVSFASERLAPNGEATLADVARHVEALVERVGIEHVALGFDRIDETTFPRQAYERILGAEATPAGHDPLGSTGFGGIRLLHDELAGMGYPEQDLVKLFGENALRVFEAVWGA